MNCFAGEAEDICDYNHVYKKYKTEKDLYTGKEIVACEDAQSFTSVNIKKPKTKKDLYTGK